MKNRYKLFNYRYIIRQALKFIFDSVENIDKIIIIIMFKIKYQYLIIINVLIYYFNNCNLSNYISQMYSDIFLYSQQIENVNLYTK